VRSLGRPLPLGGLLALCPLAQFFGAPVLGSLSDRFGRRPVLLASLAASAAFYALIGPGKCVRSLP
jgi:DHA1 family tetracycline resistance protein-like MFS transporter